MIKSEFDNALRRECYDLPILAEHLVTVNENFKEDGGIRMSLTTPELCQPRKVVLTGCGDSYCAAVAASRAFKLLGDVFDVKAMNSVEFCSHYDAGNIGTEPFNPLVYIISASGSPSRTHEAARRTNELGTGGLSVAVTKNPDSMLAQLCQKTILVRPNEFDNPFKEYPPGMRSYYASIYALLSSAIRMGEVKGHYSMGEAYAMRRATAEFAKAFEPEMERIDNQMYELAEKWKDIESFECVAAGEDMATAWFCAAKVYEASGDFVTYENVEDWAHINFFSEKPQENAVCFFANYNAPEYPRFKKSIEAAIKLGRPTLVITDAPVSDFPEEAIVCQIPSPKYYWQMPLMHHMPYALFSGYLAKFKGVEFFRTDMPDVFVSGNNHLRDSEIVVVK